MSQPNLNVILQAIVSVQNNLASNAPQIVNYDFGNPTMGALNVACDPYFQAITGIGTQVALPITGVYLIAIQNLSPNANLTVTYSAIGGSNTSATFGPAGMFVAFDPQELGSGFNYLNLTGVGGIVPAMVIIGA